MLDYPDVGHQAVWLAVEHMSCKSHVHIIIGCVWVRFPARRALWALTEWYAAGWAASRCSVTGHLSEMRLRRRMCVLLLLLMPVCCASDARRW
jgi:hypothetical protein